MLVYDYFRARTKHAFKKQNESRSLGKFRETVAKESGFSGWHEFRKVCEKNPFDRRLKSVVALEILRNSEDLKNYLLVQSRHQTKAFDLDSREIASLILRNLRIRGLSYDKERNIYDVVVDYILVLPSVLSSQRADNCGFFFNARTRLDVYHESLKWLPKSPDSPPVSIDVMPRVEHSLPKADKGPIFTLDPSRFLFVVAHSPDDLMVLNADQQCLLSKTYGITDDDIHHPSTIFDVNSLLSRHFWWPGNSSSIVFTIPRAPGLSFYKWQQKRRTALSPSAVAFHRMYDSTQSTDSDITVPDYLVEFYKRNGLEAQVIGKHALCGPSEYRKPEPIEDIFKDYDSSSYARKARIERINGLLTSYYIDLNSHNYNADEKELRTYDEYETYNNCRLLISKLLRSQSIDIDEAAPIVNYWNTFCHDLPSLGVDELVNALNSMMCDAEDVIERREEQYAYLEYQRGQQYKALLRTNNETALGG